MKRGPPAALGCSTRTDSFSLSMTTRSSFSLSVGADSSLHFDRAAEDVRFGDARAIDFDAELGAQIGHGGGGSANHK